MCACAHECVCVHVSVCMCMRMHLCVCARACLHVYGDGDTIRIAVEQEMWAMYYDQVFLFGAKFFMIGMHVVHELSLILMKWYFKLTSVINHTSQQ